MNYLVSRLFGGEAAWHRDGAEWRKQNPNTLNLKVVEAMVDYHDISYEVFVYESGHIYVASEYSAAYAWVYPPEALDHIQGVIDRVAAAPFAERFRPQA